MSKPKSIDRFVVPRAPSLENPTPLPRPRWARAAAELNGRFPSGYLLAASRLLLDSFTEVGAFAHHYKIGGQKCPTHMARKLNAANLESQVPLKREGIACLEFDTKGIYLASVTKSGCLMVHDFETLYCMVYGPSSSPLEDETKQVLHLFTSLQLDVVRWNVTNQDEVACSSRHSSKILIFDIGYVSSEPVEVLEKGSHRFTLQGCNVSNGLSDIVFTKADKSRLLASDLEGAVYVWDRRQSNLPCLELTTSSGTQLNSIQIDIEDRIVFAASKHGVIYAWDLRGGRTSLAFQSHNMVYHPLLTSVKIASMLEKITSLKEQSNIISREIHSINFNPSCPYQLAFHLDDGWSGVLDTNNFNVSHMHCPPPAWLDVVDMSANLYDLRKPSWLPMCSIYAVGSSSSNGIYLLDFYPDTRSVCHVDFNEELQSISEENKQVIHNKFVSLSESVSVCAAHPLNGTLVAGTKQSSLLVVSQKHQIYEGSSTTHHEDC